MSLKKFQKDHSFRDHAEVFECNGKTKEEVVDAGERAFLTLYNSKNETTLNSLRHNIFCKKVSVGSSYIKPESLPPTTAASAFHSMRVYYQVQQWKGNESLLPTEWGWELSNNKLLPVKTNLPAAPKALLEIIRCNCKADCSTNRCTCRRYNLECTAACGTCQGESCSNSTRPDME